MPRRPTGGSLVAVTSTVPRSAASAVVRRAQQDAAAAAARAGVRVLPLDTLAAVQEAAALFVRVWRTGDGPPPLTAEVMRAVEHAGGYAVGAYVEGTLVGASAGFLGLAGTTPVLHSHISGVALPGHGVGGALKRHQRAWALERGVTAVTWTFDPLVRRNAWFNLRTLGATGVEYLVDFYGAMTDGVNAGEDSDRLFTRWDLVEPAVPSDGAGAATALGERDGAPEPSAGTADGRPLLVRLPQDVEALRRDRPELARAWRRAVREAVVPAFADGYLARGVTRDGDLVLAR